MKKTKNNTKQIYQSCPQTLELYMHTEKMVGSRARGLGT